MRRIFHLELKEDNSHKYYGSLSALVEENTDIGISKFTLNRYDFSKPYENEIDALIEQLKLLKE